MVTTNEMIYFQDLSFTLYMYGSCAGSDTDLVITHSLLDKYVYNIGDPVMVIDLDPYVMHPVCTANNI